MNDFENDDEFEPYIDKTQEFEQYVAPLMSQMMTVCRAHGIPLALMVVYAHSNIEAGEGFGMAGGVAGNLYHMPLPMLVAGGMVEEKISTALKEARRSFISASISGDIQTAPEAHGTSLWRHALAAQVLENGDPQRADRSLHRRIGYVMDAFDGIASFNDNEKMDDDYGVDSGIDITQD